MSFANIASKKQQKQFDDYERRVQQKNRISGDLIDFDEPPPMEADPPKKGPDAQALNALRKLQDLSRELANDTALLAVNPAEVKHKALLLEDRKVQSKTLVSNVQQILDSWQLGFSNPKERFAKDKATVALAEEEIICKKRLEEFDHAIIIAKDMVAANPTPSCCADNLIDLQQSETVKWTGSPDDLIDLNDPGENKIVKEFASVVQDHQSKPDTIACESESLVREMRNIGRKGRAGLVVRIAFVLSLCVLGIQMYTEFSKGKQGQAVRHVADVPSALSQLSVNRPFHIDVIDGRRLSLGKNAEVVAHHSDHFHCTESKNPRASSISRKPSTYRCRPEI